MFGNPVRIELENFGVVLRPLKKSDMVLYVEYLQHLEVTMFTNMTFAPTLTKEEEWWEKVGNEPDTVIWGIVPDGSEVPVGVTGLHGVHPFWGCCTSGVIIGDRNWWGKGVAYRAHLARTWYAVNILNRATIQSQVRTSNTASLKALLKVGYRVSGKFDRNCYRMKLWMDTYTLSWVNPFRVGELYPEGVPDELVESLARAKEALEVADKVVKFI